ncbi:MAG: glutamine--fructose-6-phosphate transaminase (isomerizing), partial [Myxococcales bacterium]|nr:glutamine--fructose-6-phosphate transaminase (isomerizing) [Myxococcales bacterium]
MCGIVGYIGREHRAMDVLIDGLRRLEYRGYDSAGVAICDGGEIRVRRALGKLANLEGLLRDDPIAGHVGLGHTRWATHGKPSERNAHPHRSGSVVIVHNGIIENYRPLRRELEAAGRSIESETDTELIVHMIEMEIAGGRDLLTAVRSACARLVGSYAFGALCSDTPDRLVAAKNGGSPIILGLGEKQSFLASDIPAILPYTRQMLFLEDGEFALLSGDGVQVIDAEGRPVDREPRPIHWDPVSAEKGGYDRFMQKEIFEQPRAVLDTIGTRVREEDGDVDLDGIDLSPRRAEAIRRIQLVACGTAYYACMVGKYLFEQIAGVPAEVDLASEFRYRRPILDASCLVVPVSQSGETADTLAALRQGKDLGARVLSICNVRDASIARESDDVLYTHAGPEIGVASTKAFTT